MDKPFLGLRTVIYPVPDIEAAKQWYTTAFQQLPYFDETFYVGYNIGGYELGLMPDSLTNKDGETGTAYWGVIDIEAAFNHMVNLKATVKDEPYDVGGDVKVAVVKDPWGNYIGLIYNPHFKAQH